MTDRDTEMKLELGTFYEIPAFAEMTDRDTDRNDKGYPPEGEARRMTKKTGEF
jgi:hypothetical protein